jgi:hypothetical protein
MKKSNSREKTQKAQRIMNPDNFEQKLQRQPLRQVPAEWRGEILAAATSCHSSRVTRLTFFSTLDAQLSTILWPHPRAWAGLAAVWILILAVNVSMRDPSPVRAEKSSPPSPEVIVELRQQQRLLAELIGPRDTSDADRSKSFVPQPRSERPFEVLMT